MSTSKHSSAKKSAASRPKVASALKKNTKGANQKITPQEAVELAKRAGILTAAGKLAPFYR